MKIEAVKLREINQDGKTFTIMDLDDFKRLISEYNLTHTTFKQFGFSRSLWDNTTAYYNISNEDLRQYRNLIILHKDLHLNSNHGFSKIIEGKDLGDNLTTTKVKGYLKYLSKFNPTINDLWYSKLKEDPVSLSNDLANISKELIESKQILKKLVGRVRKEAKKLGLEHTRLISSTLEHSVSKILDDIGVKYKSQLYLKPYHYDFIISGKVILEVDGNMHDKRFDKEKEELAKEKGYILIRLIIDRKGIKKYNYEEYKDKISKELRRTGCL